MLRQAMLNIISLILPLKDLELPAHREWAHFPVNKTRTESAKQLTLIKQEYRTVPEDVRDLPKQIKTFPRLVKSRLPTFHASLGDKVSKALGKGDPMALEALIKDLKAEYERIATGSDYMNSMKSYDTIMEVVDSVSNDPKIAAAIEKDAGESFRFFAINLSAMVGDLRNAIEIGYDYKVRSLQDLIIAAFSAFIQRLDQIYQGKISNQPGKPT